MECNGSVPTFAPAKVTPASRGQQCAWLWGGRVLQPVFPSNGTDQQKWIARE
jgi:hypothetical protein